MYSEQYIESIISDHRREMASSYSHNTLPVGHGLVVLGAFLALAIVEAAKILARKDRTSI